MIEARFVVSDAAERDLNDYADYLREQAGPDVASRFSASARSSFQRLAEAPLLSPAVPSAHFEPTGLRTGKVAGFPKLLVFFHPVAGGIRIDRIMHGAQDWWRLLDVD